MDLIDVIAINVVREGNSKSRKVPLKTIAAATGGSVGTAYLRVKRLRSVGVLPPKPKTVKGAPKRKPCPIEAAKRAAARERRRLAQERQANVS